MITSNKYRVGDTLICVNTNNVISRFSRYDLQAETGSGWSEGKRIVVDNIRDVYDKRKGLVYFPRSGNGVYEKYLALHKKKELCDA